MTWLDDAKQAILESSSQSSIYIGADSIRYKKRGEWYAKYTVVVIVHIDSRHGCKLFHNSFVERDYGFKHDCRARMMREAQAAIDVGLEIRDFIGHNNPRHIQIHLDINPCEEHASSVAVKEALGWAVGLGFDAKVKPDSWASTHAADWAVRHLN